VNGSGNWVCAPDEDTVTPADGADGSVQFAAGGSFASDNANFFWDDTNDRLGIGNATPATALDVIGTASVDNLILGATDLSTCTTGQILKVNASGDFVCGADAGAGGADASSIRGVTVNATTPTTDNEVLVYNSATTEWQVGGPINSVATLDLSSCNDDEILKNNAGTWQCEADGGSALTYPLDIAGATEVFTDSTMNSGSGASILTIDETDNNMSFGPDAASVVGVTQRSLFIGENAGRDTTGGLENVFIGYRAGEANLTGEYNTAIGVRTMAAATQSDNSVYIGEQAGFNIGASGNPNNNVIVGGNAANYITNASTNVVAIGRWAGASDGSNAEILDSVFMGTDAGRAIAANDSVMIGHSSGRNTSTGAENIFIGKQSGDANVTGASNIVIGSGTEVDGTNTGTSYRLNIGSAIYGTYGTDSTTEGDGTADLTVDGDLDVTGTLSAGTLGLTYPLDLAGATEVFNDTVSGNSIMTVDPANFNLFLGDRAGQSNTSGQYNVFIGIQAGQSNTTNGANTYIGYQAGRDNVDGKNNTFIGWGANSDGTTGSDSTIVGDWAGRYNEASGVNFFGRFAGHNNTTGTGNVFMGHYAGESNTTASNNTYIGNNAGRNNDQLDNVAIGNKALQNGNGRDNVFIGRAAGEQSGNVNSNVVIGETAGFELDGVQNVFLGQGTGSSATTADQNILIGRDIELINNTDDNYLSIGNAIFGDMGDQTSRNDSTADLTIDGDLTVSGNLTADLSYPLDLAGATEVFNDTVSGNSIMTVDPAHFNLFLGDRAGENTDTSRPPPDSRYNVFIGNQAGQSNLRGTANTFIGDQAGRDHVNGNDNVFVGWGAGQDGSGCDRCTIVGDNAGRQVSGDRNSFFGRWSGYNTASGLENTFLGYDSGMSNVTGSHNIVIGSRVEVDGSNTGTDYRLNIGSAIYGTYGTDSTTEGDGTADLTIDGDLTVVGTFTNPSDIRLKDEIRPIQTALDKVLSLRGVTYTWKGKRNDGKRHMGVIAQEVEEVLPELVHTKDLGGGERMKTVDYQGMVPALIEAIKQQQAQIQYLKQELDALKAAGGR
jgi:hypothetical protein